MFNELYKVMVKGKGKKRFVGTGRTVDGEITIETNVIHQAFYSKEDAIKLSQELERETDFTTKIERGN